MGDAKRSDPGGAPSSATAVADAAGSKSPSDLPPAPVPALAEPAQDSPVSASTSVRESHDKVAVSSTPSTRGVTAVVGGESANDGEHAGLLAVAENSECDSEHASDNSDTELCWPDDPAPLFYCAPTRHHAERARARARASRTSRASTQRAPPANSSPPPSPSLPPTHARPSTVQASAGASVPPGCSPAPAHASEMSADPPAGFDARANTDTGNGTTAQELLQELAKELDFLRSEEFAKYVLCHGDKMQTVQVSADTGADVGSHRGAARVPEVDSVDAVAQASGDVQTAGNVQPAAAPTASHVQPGLDQAISNFRATQLPASKAVPVVTSAQAKHVDSNAVVAGEQPAKHSVDDLLHRKRTKRRARSTTTTTAEMATATATATAVKRTALSTEGPNEEKAKSNHVHRNRAGTASTRGGKRLAKLSFRGRPKAMAMGDGINANNICTSAQQRYS